MATRIPQLNRTGYSIQDILNRTEREDSQNRTVGTGQLEGDSQSRIDITVPSSIIEHS
jgi:hypothetical protein